MTTASSGPSWFQTFRCRDCGSEVGFRSRPRNLSERYILPVFLLRPVRCGECFRRDYRLVFIPVRQRPSEVSGILPVSPALSAQTPAAAKRNVA